MVGQYPVQEAIISFLTQHHKLDTNCAVRMTRLWTFMTSKFHLELILATSSYISCMYNSLWCVGLVSKVDEEQGHVYIQFMHPHRPQKTFNQPQGGDSCYFPIKNIACAIQAPTTNTGRTYRICDEDYHKTVAAFAKLHLGTAVDLML